MCKFDTNNANLLFFALKMPTKPELNDILALDVKEEILNGWL